jgi:hypothetical protein
MMLRKNLTMTINVENLTKSVNRKWMSKIESHGMGPRVNVYAKYQEAVISSC